MSGQFSNEPMLDMYIFETSQNIEQLEACILSSEKTSCYTEVAINEIFRIMHTIKGSSAMMLFNNISLLAHSIEDLFYFLREEKPKDIDCSTLSDLIFEGVDFIKVELQKIKDGNKADGDSSLLIEKIKEFLEPLKQQNPSKNESEKSAFKQPPHYYIASENKSSLSNFNYFKATIFFEDGCEMENIRGYTIVHNLKEFAEDIYYLPNDIIDNDDSVEVIRKEGFKVFVKTDKSYEAMNDFFNQTIFLKELEFIQLEDKEEFLQFNDSSQTIIKDNPVKVPQLHSEEQERTTNFTNQSIISVNVAKLDKLMDLVGEMVIAEAMVTQNPEVRGLQLDNFQKAARQLHKITSELQDMVMSIRMVPLSTTFQKMHRIVRDMNKKLGKEVQLELIGEETEVDKNIIEHISDPLMHLVRNSIDHGIETMEDREIIGKPKAGKVTLEAKNSGSDVFIIVKDDGRGLNKEKILERARKNSLLTKPVDEMTDKDIYNLIFLPGFSTKDNITEFSGRGVGMDVVVKNIETVGGMVSIDSTAGVGSTITTKIPLTLAIIDGMNIQVGNSRYTIPITAIKESFKPKEADLIRDPDGNEMIMVRGQCYPIIRLHQVYKVKKAITEFTEGILIMVGQDEKNFCLFADKLLGQQQVVIKTLPNYLKKIKKIQGIAGCTLLGDGSISLILDTSRLANKE